MDKAERVQQLCSEHSQELKGLALDVCSHGRWDMNLPVAVIDARKTPHRFHISAVGTIGNILRVSTTADNPLMQQLFELYEQQGSDAALEHMLNDDEIASVLTFVRNSYGNKSSAVSAAQVAKIREQKKDMLGLYSPDALLKEHPIK